MVRILREDGFGIFSWRRSLTPTCMTLQGGGMAQSTSRTIWSSTGIPHIITPSIFS